MNKGHRARRGKTPKRRFYRIVPAEDGLVDIWLTPGDAVMVFNRKPGGYDYHVRVLAVRGIDPEDPQWGGDLEGHIRRHYSEWTASAEEIEI